MTLNKQFYKLAIMKKIIQIPFIASLFISYIFANNLDSYSDAEEYYNKFLNLFPESDLIHSVNYELEVLEPLLIKIDSLNKN